MADENLKIDLDRGVRMSKDPVSQLEVYMYYDDPGVYLTPLGTPVPEEIAARAGYDVEKFGMQRVKAAKVKDFMEMLEADDKAEGGETLEERGGYRLVLVGTLGHVKVTDYEGNSVVAMPLPRELGQDLFDRLAGPEKAVPPAKKSGVKSLDDNA